MNINESFKYDERDLGDNLWVEDGYFNRFYTI